MAREQSVVARDFLGIDLNMGDAANGDIIPSKQKFSHGKDHTVSISVSPGLNNMSMADMKSSSWSTTQHFLYLRGSFDERFKEQIVEDLSERPFTHFVHPLQMQDLASNNQKKGFSTQGDSVIKSSGQVCEEFSSSIPISIDSQGVSTRNMISTSKPEAMAVSGTSTASETRLPSSGTTGMQHNAPLTIFYGGSVKVFNNISTEQAQAIMRLASSGNGEGNLVKLMAATVAVESTNGMVTSNLQDKSLMNLQSIQALVNQQQTKANHVNQLTTTNMQLAIKNLNIPSPSSPGSPGPPMVPTALPQARKASLARFLEKRRERAHSKCPYPLRQEDSSFPGERLSSTSDRKCCGDGVHKKKALIPYWMQTVSECSSDAVVKEQKITVT